MDVMIIMGSPQQQVSPQGALGDLGAIYKGAAVGHRAMGSGWEPRGRPEDASIFKDDLDGIISSTAPLAGVAMEESTPSTQQRPAGIAARIARGQRVRGTYVPRRGRGRVLRFQLET
jgi:hypothetical protein